MNRKIVSKGIYRRSLQWGLAAMVMAMTVWAASCSARTGSSARTESSARTASPDQGIASLQQTGKAFASIAKAVSPGVVFVRVDKTVHREPVRFGFDDDFFRHFFGAPFDGEQGGAQHVVGQGSGFIVSKDGYVLTNTHVVGDADRVTVTLQDGRSFTAKSVVTDPRSDVAVMKIDADDLEPLPLGDSDSLVVGEWVVAVGNPFGLSHTITAGIVSATGRSSIGIADYEDFIQTDAAINPGNSGGPLINLKGEVVGMNTAIVGGAGGNVGVGFAIPINMAKEISDQLIAKGSVTRGHLGVIVQDMTPDLASSFGLKEDTRGVVVSQVLDDTPAQKAGLRRGDVILELDGHPVAHGGDLRNEIAVTTPGKKVKLTLQRDGKRKSVEVTVAAVPEPEQMARAGGDTMNHLGLAVQNLTPQIAQQLGIDERKGVVVTNVESGSAADLAGIRPGEVILEANRKPVASTDDFKRALNNQKDQDAVLLLVKDRDYSRFVVIRAG